jgi:hypothetical protein
VKQSWLFSAVRFLCRRSCRSIDHTAAAFELLPDIPFLMKGRMLVGKVGTSSGLSGRTRRGVMSTISSVCSARVALLLKSAPMIGSLPRIGIAAASSCEALSSSPAIANDCPSRNSTSVSARLVVSAGIRKPESVILLVQRAHLRANRVVSRPRRWSA